MTPAGLVLGGELHRGRNGAAGELDYAREGREDDVDPCAGVLSALAAQIAAGGGTELDSFFVAEARRLQFEHRMVPAAGSDQLIVRAQLDYLAVFQNANPVGMTHRREAVRDQDSSRVARSGQNAVEDLSLAAYI